jgi:branched-subunit amino acid aminotransferase/4-amino-4-deoxychorismate lyase
MHPEFLVLDGKYYKSEEKVLSHKNRAFCYGDALFETIHCLGTQPQFFEAHWNRLVKGLKILKMVIDKDFNPGLIHKHIEKLLNKNRIFKGARLRLTVFREADGLYGPENESVSWIMETSALPQEKYELNSKGLVISIFDDVLKPVNILSNLKTTNALPYILAAKFRKDNNLDDCILLNQYGRIAESISSNIFITKGKSVITPSLSEGCIEGTMRQTVLEIADKIGYRTEEKPLFEKDIIDAEEVFFTNAISGIKWVVAYKDRRYFNFISRKLSINLNELGFVS